MGSTMRQRLTFAVKRALIVALAGAVALATFVSALTIVELHDHDCSGESCPICLVLEAAQAMLGFTAAHSAQAAAGAAAITVLVWALAAWALSLPAKTPVSEKVLLLI